MKITKRQLKQIIKEEKAKLNTRRELRRIIRENVEPMTQGYVLRSLDQVMTFGPNKGKSRGEIVMDKLMSKRYHEAAGSVMDALMIDDHPAGADDELAQILKSTRSLEQVALAAADWGTKHFRMR